MKFPSLPSLPALNLPPALKTIVIWVGGTVLVAAAYRAYEWRGVLLVVTVFVFWVMLHFTRLIQAMKRAADRPVGYIGSAVMLNAKLKVGWSLLHLVAQTKSLGALQSKKDEEPAIFRWTDNGGSFVDCTFINGVLTQWQLVRPDPTDPATHAK
jgi:hypothetical protein